MKTKLSIIIVNFNTKALLKNCLLSLKKSLVFSRLTEATEVIIVDNGSIDGSASMVKREYPEVILIQNKINLGFAKANNQAIKTARGEYFLLLNSDTKVYTDALKKLFDFVNCGRNIGVVGGKLLNPDGSIQPSAGYFPDLKRVLFWMMFIDDLPYFSLIFGSYHQNLTTFYQKMQQPDWVSGACFLINKEIISRAGLMDERIFMYGEEVEWCYRIKKIGYKVFYLPQVQVIHYKGESAKEKDNAGVIEEYQSIIYFYKKHKPIWQLFIVKILLKFGALLRLALFGIIIKNSQKAKIYAKAYSLV